MEYDCIVVGAGFAGVVAARELAERGHRKVLLLENRDHSGGNACDYMDESGLLVHKYGPHIFHTSHKRVYDYLSRFTAWRSYEHRVLADVYGKLLPVPFNLKSLRIAFGTDRAARLQQKLADTYGMENKVGILDLKKQADPALRDLAEYIYQNIFLRYTQKQWGTGPEDIDPAVTARVPVFISEDDRYFQDAYQGMPQDGYAALFKNMLDHPDITVQLHTDALKLLQFEKGTIFCSGIPFKGTVVYTGAIDELFGCCYGRLPYRTLEFEFETWNMEWKQPCGTVNYTVDRPYTRITEFKHLTGQANKNKTATVKEYPRDYRGNAGEIPCYPVVNADSTGLYDRYFELAQAYPGLHLIGRLAEFKYYNMDVVVERALELADRLIG